MLLARMANLETPDMVVKIVSSFLYCMFIRNYRGYKL